MPGASGQSKREVLERLMAELQRLTPDAREPEVKNWRACVNATMSDLFGPRHRLTVNLREVTFAPDFGRGRARALALLRAASSLATAPPKSKAPPARPATTAGPPGPDATTELPGIDATAGTSRTLNDDASAQPSGPTEATAQPMSDTAAGPTPDAIEPKHETIFRRIVRKRDISGTHPAIPDEPTGAYRGASLRPKRGLKRPTIAAIVIIFLALAVGLPVWLVWFGGGSTMFGQESTTVTNAATSLSNSSMISPSANSRVVDATGDPRSAYIVEVVRAGIVQLKPNEAGEISFLPTKLVGRGEFLVWLDRVRPIPAGSGGVPDTFYYDLDPPLRKKAIDAYQRRIVLEWPGEDMKIAFNAANPILAREVEAWAARMIIAVLPATALQSALGITEADALDLRVRISSLEPQELATIVEGFKLLPEAGWAKEESISRSEAAEFLMRLKAVFDKYLAA